MVMKGVAKFGMLEAYEKGIKAGLNMFICRNSNPETISVIEELARKSETDIELKENIEKSYEKIINLKKERGIL